MHLMEIPSRKRTYGSACDSTSGPVGASPAQRASMVLSWRRLLLSRAKLKATSRTSALLSGFAMVAMVEIQLDDGWMNGCPEKNSSSSPQQQLSSSSSSLDDEIAKCHHYNALLVAFAIVTTLLIATHMFALLISTCILPNLEAVTSVSGCGIDISESPHDQFHWYIETAWICSTGLGIILFLVEIGLLCWIKFFKAAKSAWASTVILIPLVLIFAYFAFEFYRRLVAHKEATTDRGVRELEEIAHTLLKLEDENPVSSNHDKYSSNDVTQHTTIGSSRSDGDCISTGTNGSDDAGNGGGVIY